MSRWLIFLCSAMLSAAFIINLCNLVYQCGCRSWWAGAETHCNIHQHAVPHCPFCVNTTGAGIVFTCILAAQFLASRWRGSVWAASSLAIVAFPVVGATGMLVLGLLAGYWD
jgi:sugar/nucleoside kinase (ribokinase family)